jgi:hypothetical protein
MEEIHSNAREMINKSFDNNGVFMGESGVGDS